MYQFIFPYSVNPKRHYVVHKVIFIKEADEKDQLYGSISKKEIINQFKDNDIYIHSDDIEMQYPIRELGEHEVTISPYLNISYTLKIKVNKN